MESKKPATLDLFNNDELELSLSFDGDEAYLKVLDRFYIRICMYKRETEVKGSESGTVYMYRLQSEKLLHSDREDSPIPHDVAPLQVAIKQERAPPQQTGTISILSKFDEWIPSRHKFVRTVDGKCHIRWLEQDSGRYNEIPLDDKYARDHIYTRRDSQFDIPLRNNRGGDNIHLRVHIFRSVLLSNDQIAVQMLSDVHCGQIQARIVSEHNNPDKTVCFTLLPMMMGSLHQGVVEHYAKSNSISLGDAAVRIVDDVRKHVMCLLTASDSIFYANVTATNIQWSMYTDNDNIPHYTFRLGDIGSIVPNGNGEYTFTYPYVRGKRRYNIPHGDKENCLAFLLGILLCDLLGLQSKTTYLSHHYSTTLTAVADNYILNDLRSELRSILPAPFKYLEFLLFRDNGFDLRTSFAAISHPQWSDLPHSTPTASTRSRHPRLLMRLQTKPTSHAAKHRRIHRLQTQTTTNIRSDGKHRDRPYTRKRRRGDL